MPRQREEHDDMSQCVIRTPDYIQKERAKWQTKGIAFMLRRNFVAKLIGSTRNKRIMDFGCSVGSLLMFLAEEKTALCHGIDVTDSAINLARRRNIHGNLEFFSGDERSAKIRENYYDVITCTEVLEHVEDDAGLVRIFRRKLRRGGCVIVTVPSEKNQLKHPTHRRIYDRRSLKKLFEDNGYETKSIKYYGFPVLKILLVFMGALFPGKKGEINPMNVGCLAGSKFSRVYEVSIPLFMELVKVDTLFGKLGLGTGLVGKFILKE